MKHLIAAVLVATSISAHALEFAMPNKAGGEIRLTTAQCPDRDTTWYVMYSYSPTGGVSYGCWFASDGMVHVAWKDGEKSVFKASNFKSVGNQPSKGTAL